MHILEGGRGATKSTLFPKLRDENSLCVTENRAQRKIFGLKMR
jgi:predicted ATPase